MSFDLVIRGGTVVTAEKTLRADIGIEGEKIAAIRPGLSGMRELDAGGKLIMPKTPIPTVGYFAYCQDTEGNLFGVMQSDPSAK